MRAGAGSVILAWLVGHGEAPVGQGIGEQAQFEPPRGGHLTPAACDSPTPPGCAAPGIAPPNTASGTKEAVLRVRCTRNDPRNGRGLDQVRAARKLVVAMNVLPFSRRLQTLLGTRKQAWLASRAGVEKSTISRLMRGTQKPTADTLHHLAGVLEVSVAVLVEGTDAADNIEEAARTVRQADYDAVVRKYNEEEGRRQDAERVAAGFKQELSREREANRRLRADNDELHKKIQQLQDQLTSLGDRLNASVQQMEALRQELLEKADDLRRVGVENATLHAQIEELAEAVRTGKQTSKVAAIMASVAAIAGVGSYFAITNDDEEEGHPQPKDARRKTRR